MVLLQTKQGEKSVYIAWPHRELISRPLDCLPVQGIVHLGGFPRDGPGCLATASSNLPQTMAGVVHISAIGLFFFFFFKTVSFMKIKPHENTASQYMLIPNNC